MKLQQKQWLDEQQSKGEQARTAAAQRLGAGDSDLCQYQHLRHHTAHFLLVQRRAMSALGEWSSDSRAHYTHPT